MRKSRPSPNSEKRPPIMVRSATFLTKISEEAYEQYFHEWEQEIGGSLPMARREPRWKFELDGYENGLPKLKDTRPSLWIDSWHEKDLGDGKGKNTIRVFPSDSKGYGGITFTVERLSGTASRSYTELRSFFTDYLGIFCKVFKVQNFPAVDLLYMNLVRSDLYPEFNSDNMGGLELGRILETHKDLHLPGHGFLLPYKHQMICKASKDKPMLAHIDIEVESSEEKSSKDPHVNLVVDLTLRSIQEPTAQPFNTISAMSEMDECHEKVLEFFRATFTEEARKVFSYESDEESP